MLQKLSHFTYASKMNLALALNKRLFSDIEQQSSANNKKSGITGFLLFKDGRFFQYFEGEETACLQLLEALKNDSRHKDIKIISEGEIKERVFATWSMSCYNLDVNDKHNESLNLPDMVMDFDVFKWDSENVEVLVSQMSRNHLIFVTPEPVSYISVLANRFVNQHRVFLVLQTLIGLCILLSLVLLYTKV